MPPWFSNMLSGLGSWLVNPWLFLAGSLLVAVPIIIHLLNRRKFKIVDWAAMEFLLEADKKNRRRVRLENFLLLLMRCLAVFLLGLLLARPFDSSGLAAKLFNAQQFERILLIDNSLSMKARSGNRTVMEISKERVTDLVRQFAGEKSDNTLTVLLTSDPERKKFHGSPINGKNVDDILAELNELAAVDSPAQLTRSLRELEDYLSSQAANVNRVVYVISDLRRTDWQPASEGEQIDSQPVELLRGIAKAAKGCFVVDVAEEEDRNLVIREVRAEKTLVAGVESRFEVDLENPGTREVANVKVRFMADDSVPLKQEVEKLAPGEKTT